MQKIHFNNRHGLTRAVVEEYKTKTRRIATFDELKEPNTGWLTEQPEAGRLVLCDGVRIVAKSQYKMNEILAVAQSYKSIHEEMMNGDYGNSRYDAFRCAMVAGTKGWDNKMFVKADLMPYQIRITDIKVERLQDISDEDCMLEGIQEFDTPVGKCYVAGGVYVGQDGRLKIAKGMVNLAKPFKTPQEAFATLIERPGIGHKGDWSKNPWVFAYTFKLIK